MKLDITGALTPSSPDTLAETLDTLGVQAHQTVCYSVHFPPPPARHSRLSLTQTILSDTGRQP